MGKGENMSAIATAVVAGSVITGSAAKSAANTGANASLESARIGAQAGAFRPQNITTRFGSSNFQMGTDPETGLPILESAGYELSPELASLQDRLIGFTPGALERGLDAYNRIRPIEEAVPGLFGLSTQFLGESPQAIRQKYIDDQLAALEPSRIREEQRLGASVFGRGRAGLNVGDIGSPDLYSLAAARRQQELGLAAGAEDAVRQRIATGTGLLGTSVDLLGAVPAYETAALSPYSSYLSNAQIIEQLGQDPLRLGAELGGRASTAGQAGGQLLAQAGQNAANLRMQGSLVGPTMMAGTLNNVLGNPYLMQGMSNMSNPFSVGGMFSPYQVSTQGPSGLTQSQILTSQNF